MFLVENQITAVRVFVLRPDDYVFVPGLERLSLETMVFEREVVRSLGYHPERSDGGV